MIPIITIIFFVLGLIIGSFLNVIIYRYNTGRSAGGRSACMSCQSQLRWHELIPVFSFVALSGRCRSCKTQISIQYPLVELASGLVFAALFCKFSAIGGSAYGGQVFNFLSNPIFIITYAYYAAMFSLLIVIAAYDLKHKIIPDMLALIFGSLAFAGLFFFSNATFYPHIPTALELLSGVFIALPFAFFWFVSSGRWMGFGDAKLSLGLGWFLGLSTALSALMIAFWSGAIAGILLMIFNKKYGMKSELPFALYLVSGSFIAFIFNLCFLSYLCY